MQFKKSVTSFCALIGVAVGLTLVGLPAQAAPNGMAAPPTPDLRGPCAWDFQQMVLSPDMTGNGYGDVLLVDGYGFLCRFGYQPGAVLNQPSWSGGFDNTRIAAPGDWNRDGKADVIGVVNGHMFLYPGIGSGNWGKGTMIGHGWSYYTVIPVGDLTGDGLVNLLAVDNRIGVLLMYSSNGRGGFQPGHTQVGHGWKNMRLLAAGDLNRDGRADILGVTADGRLLFYAGKGTGSFQKPVQVGHGWMNLNLAAGADLDGDGKADIIGWKPGGDLLFYRGKGLGTFEKPVVMTLQQ